jgi:hypothetical protein
MRFVIESSPDGVVWTTRDACDSKEQYESSLDALELFDETLMRYRVFDRDTRTVVLDVAADDVVDEAEKEVA